MALLCAAGLALAPMAASNASAAPAAMAGCTVDGHMPSKPADRPKSDCCTVACPMNAAALLPERRVDGARLNPSPFIHNAATAQELASVAQSELDPPPRLPS